MDKEDLLHKKLDTIIDLLRQLVALEFSDRGVSRAVIGKRLRVAKSTVIEMLKGMKAE
jgi:Mn-dependent DtxR family transcriptional regulator